MSGAPRAPRARRVAPQRDQVVSEFTLILEQVVHETPAARAAALFDEEGETVDYAGRLDPFDVRVVAAHSQILLAELRELTRAPAPKHLRIRAQSASYVVAVLDACYSLVIVTHPRAAFSVSPRVLRDAEVRLAAEAGITVKPIGPPWSRVHVQHDATTRVAPSRIRPVIGGDRGESAWYGIDVLGCLVGLARGETGFRVRLDTGMEANLVRERSMSWFVDESLV